MGAENIRSNVGRYFFFQTLKDDKPKFFLTDFDEVLTRSRHLIDLSSDKARALQLTIKVTKPWWKEQHYRGHKCHNDQNDNIACHRRYLFMFKCFSALRGFPAVTLVDRLPRAIK